MSRPVLSVTVPNTPITDANGRITFTWLKWFQALQQTINAAFDQQGEYQGALGSDTTISGHSAPLAVVIQNITDIGTISSDFVTDGHGDPITGGKLAFAALFASHPNSGDLLEFNGTQWLPSPAPKSLSKAVKKWLDSYDATTGLFTQSQPSFGDLAGMIAPGQLPLATLLSVGVVKPDGTTITIDPDGTIHAAAATSSSPGIVQPDNTTITISGGVISAASGSGGINQLTGDVTAGPGAGSQAATVVSTHLSAPLPVVQGGSGSASPSLVAGSNVTITGSWPNQTVTASSTTVPVGLVQIVQENNAATNSGAVSCAFLHNVQKGSGVVVEWFGGTVATITDSQGNSYTAYNSANWLGGNGPTQFVALNVAAGALTVNASVAGTINIYEYSNLDSVEAFSFSTSTTTSLTTTVPLDVIHLSGAENLSGQTITNANSWALIQNVSNVTWGITWASFWTTIATSGSVSNTLTLSGAPTHGYIAMLALKPRAVPPAGVASLNTLTGALNITAGTGVTVTPSGSNIQIAASGSGTGFSPYPAVLTPPVSSNFSWVNQASSVAFDKSDRMAVTKPNSNPTVAISMLIATASLPATPYTLDIGAMTSLSDTGTNGALFGIALANNSNDAVVWGTLVNSAQMPSTTYRAKWTSSGTVQASSVTTNVNCYANALQFLRITDDGATRSFYYSQNGKDYYLFRTEATNTDVTPTHGGLVFYNNAGAAGTNTAVFSIYHFLVTNSILPQFAS